MIPKGKKLLKEDDVIVSRRILIKFLELQKKGVRPTIVNLGPMGCSRDRVLKIRNELIRDGLVTIPSNEIGILVRKPCNRVRKIKDRAAELERANLPTPDEPSMSVRESIEAEIQSLRETKELKYRPVEIKICKVII